MKFIVHILIAMLLFPAQSLSYLSRVDHIVEAESAASFEHELMHTNENDADHPHDLSSPNGEHRHSPDGPIHSHVNCLNPNFVQLSLPSSNTLLREMQADLVLLASDYFDDLVSNIHVRSLFRPPIA